MSTGTYGTPRVTTVDPHFERAFEDLRNHALEAQTAAVEGGQRKWFRPTIAEVDFDDRESFALPFSREALTAKLVEGFSNTDNPGTASDTVAGQTMIEMLSLLEREYLTRHTLSRIRAEAAVASRFYGHGQATGPLTQNTVEYVRRLIEGGTVTV